MHCPPLMICAMKSAPVENGDERDDNVRTATLDGKRIIYGGKTVFEVQVGRGHGQYETRYSFEGELARALFYYKAVNIGNGYKKRLIMVGAQRPVLARQIS